ncbi:MAG TPA: site-specific integrase [Acidimicrobiales bacterium]|nr:site-specific integrase [Acidimicrobiales bacterium]
MSRRSFGTIRKLPSGRFQVRYRDHVGALVAAPVTFARKADASRWLAEREGDAGRGIFIDHRAARMTFAEWAEQWQQRPGIAASTSERDARFLRLYILPAIGGRPLGLLSPLDMQRLTDDLASRLAPNTVRAAIGVARAVLTAAVDADILVRSPARRLRVAGYARKDRPALTVEQVNQLADATGPRWRAMVLTAAYCGLRASELAGLRVADVDFLRRRINVAHAGVCVNGRVVDKTTKTRFSTAAVAAPEFVVDELALHLKANRSDVGSDDYVFVGPKGGRVRSNQWGQRVLGPACRRAGLPVVGTQDLRHLHATVLAGLGVHPSVAQRRLRHAKSSTTLDIYTHVGDDADRAVANLLEGLHRSGTQVARPAK